MNPLLLDIGQNKITVSQVVACCHQYINNWNAFVWYMTDHAPIINYGKNWIIIIIKSEKHLSYVIQKIREYNSDLWENNYEVDIENDLYLTHKPGMNENIEIIKQLVGRKIN